MKNWKKALSVGLTALLLISLLAGCGSSSASGCFACSSIGLSPWVGSLPTALIARSLSGL